MSNFLENYGKAIFVLVLVAILIAFASPIGIKIKTAVLAQVDKTKAIGQEEIDKRNDSGGSETDKKNYETVDMEKSWTETHTDSYFFERVSSDKTNVDYNKWKSNNNDVDGTSAISTFTIDAPKDMEYSFDWTVSSESNYDTLTITCNETTIIDGVSGIDNGTEKVTLKSGSNTLTVTYSKDSSGADGDDCATITLPNIKVSSCKNKQIGEIFNHTYDNGKITKEPTCTENGEKTFTCKNCGHTKNEVVEKLGHKFVNEVCTRCGLKISDIQAGDPIYCIYYEDGELIISQDKIEPEVGRNVEYKGFFDRPNECTMDMTSVKFVGIVKPKNCYGWFPNLDGNSCWQLTEFKNIENLCTSECTDMSAMFQYCASLISIDLSHFDTKNVWNMCSMFSDSAFISLDLSSFNTNNVTDMRYMFGGCSNLTSLNLSSFDISNVDVENLEDMFYGCTSLQIKSVKVSQATYDKLKTVSNLGITMDKFDIVK